MERPQKKNLLNENNFSFARRIIQLYKHLKTAPSKFVLSKQLLQSSTCIGAQIQESQNAAGKKDFLNKPTIALKQANETQYWLDLLLNRIFQKTRYTIH